MHIGDLLGLGSLKTFKAFNPAAHLSLKRPAAVHDDDDDDDQGCHLRALEAARC